MPTHSACLPSCAAVAALLLVAKSLVIPAGILAVALLKRAAAKPLLFAKLPPPAAKPLLAAAKLLPLAAKWILAPRSAASPAWACWLASAPSSTAAALLLPFAARLTLAATWNPLALLPLQAAATSCLEEAATRPQTRAAPLHGPRCERCCDLPNLISEGRFFCPKRIR